MPRTSANDHNHLLDTMDAQIDAGDLVAATKTLDQMPEALQKKPRAQILLAAAYLKIGETDRAREAVKAADAGEKMGLKALITKAAVLKQLRDVPGRHATLQEIAARRPDMPWNLFELGKSHLTLGNLDDAEQIADRLAALGTRSELLWQLRYALYLQKLDLAGMIRTLDGILETQTTLPRLPQLMFTLRELPEPDRSRLKEAFLAKWPDMGVKLTLWGDGVKGDDRQVPSPAEALQDAPACVPRPDLFLRPLVEDHGAELVESAPGGSGVTLLVFSGFADRAMVPVEWVDAFCAARNHSAIYLRDFGRSLYVNGIESVASGYEETIAALQQVLARHGTRRLLCLGTSAGGFGAIRYGLRLGAAGILTASPPISFKVVDELGDSRARLLVHRMYALFGRENLDLSRDVREAGGSTQLGVWFGEASEMDAAHARCLEGLPGVSLHPIPGLDRHGSFSTVLESGAFAAFLDD